MVPDSLGANAEAVGMNCSKPDLQAVMDAWPILPDAIKMGILAMVRATLEHSQSFQ